MWMQHSMHSYKSNFYVMIENIEEEVVAVDAPQVAGEEEVPVERVETLDSEPVVQPTA
jgi:hypothetical protein